MYASYTNSRRKYINCRFVEKASKNLNVNLNKDFEICMLKITASSSLTGLSSPVGCRCRRWRCILHLFLFFTHTNTCGTSLPLWYRSSLTLSIHLFLCLLWLLVIDTNVANACAANLELCNRSKCLNHCSVHLYIFRASVSMWFKSSMMSSCFFLCLLLTPASFLNHTISAVSILWTDNSRLPTKVA